MKLLILIQLSLSFYSFSTSFSIHTVLLPLRVTYLIYLLNEVKYKHCLTIHPTESFLSLATNYLIFRTYTMTNFCMENGQFIKRFRDSSQLKESGREYPRTFSSSPRLKSFFGFRLPDQGSISRGKPSFSMYSCRLATSLSYDQL